MRGGATVDATGVALGPMDGLAVHLQDRGSLTMTASRVADVSAREVGPSAIVDGVRCFGVGTRCDFSRVTFVRVHGTALGVYRGATADVSDSWIHDTPSAWTGELGIALLSEGGSRVEARRVVVDGSHRVGVVASGEGSVLTLVDSVVRDTEPQVLDGTFGIGLASLAGARFDATRVLVQRSAEAGIGAILPGTTMRLEDVIVDGVRPTGRGYGIGIGISGGARLDFERTSVVGVRGVALASAATGDVAVIRGTEVVGRDAYVRSILPTTISYDPAHPDRASGMSVAYGLHAAEGCRLHASRVALVDGGYGYFNVGGEMILDQAAISGQTAAVGGGSDPASLAAVRIQRLSQRANAGTGPVVALGLPRAPPPGAGTTVRGPALPMTTSVEPRYRGDLRRRRDREAKGMRSGSMRGRRSVRGFTEAATAREHPDAALLKTHLLASRRRRVAEVTETGSRATRSAAVWRSSPTTGTDS